ncbi:MULTISPECIES: hypothetical protein [unclassified Pseudomonas]|uniref:PD-(D/E)XK nuclease domain-containing protein n=1 Tax=unclassified Pseudomonas TaxID=196821 RepID=UPI000C884356|nr:MULTISPECIES: hypothetical protein [unclassified Pseudomonas]PNA00939.1 hypothetical protein C1X79_05630 [Pseudomonas sp. FW305-42]PNA24850.1 hypothetical protein C1X78_09885 [Pseudomonas sp. MPR-R1B]PNB25017.1 hypothetical protein C1X80_15145 [Pseudomonas sp. DP16D-E2]PNB43313.1 hypothetical protein C1X75_11210 [Pseudomonas sp. FW305-17]PNB61537.1 hypothetical protein C1X77_11770 [Pseudomonas sp. GW531-E2]
MVFNECSLIESIATTLDQARKAELACDRASRQPITDSVLLNESYFAASQELQTHLQAAFREICLLAEKLGVPQGLSTFQRDFENALGTSELEPCMNEGRGFSPALKVLEVFFNSLQVISGHTRTTANQAFEHILRSTPKMFDDLFAPPANEAEVRNAVLKVAQFAFPDIQREAVIPGSLKLHRTDLAVPSLRTVVEFKFARTLTTAKSCVDEFYSDMKAYTQTHQWAHFYAVLYIRGNFMTQVDLDQAFKEKNADRNWTPILLTGPVKGN